MPETRLRFPPDQALLSSLGWAGVFRVMAGACAGAIGLLYMLRNLANCHEQLGEFGKLQAVRAMLKCCDRATSADAAATAMPYAGSNGEADPMSVLADGLGEMQNMSPQQQQQQLMRMLHLLQLQQNAAE